MKVLLLAIGKRHEHDFAAAIEDYTKRLNRYAPTTWRLLSPAPGKMTTNQARRDESTYLLGELSSNDCVILLDEIGEQLTSPELATKIEQLEQAGKQRLVFVIGGAYGVDKRLKDRADFIWALSKLVFPHQLVRVILAEQLYRAQTIIAGEPYHHA